MPWNLILYVVFSYISAWLTPKPPPPKAATKDDLKVPRATEGDEIGKLYGTRWLKSPQAAWDGDFRTEAIKASGGKK